MLPVYTYLEWFDPFGNAPISFHDLYSIKCIIRNCDQMATVVPIGRLQRSLHLFPAFDTNQNNEVWSHYDILEKCSTFM